MVSIIIPVFNAAKTIERCIQSIKCQTYTNWQVLLIDNGSTDQSWQICNDITRNDNRFCIFKCHNGVSIARNEGLKNAIGDYVLFVDADDTISPNALNVLISYDADIVRANFSRINTNGNVEVASVFFKGYFSRQQILSTILPAHISQSLNHINAPVPMCSIWGTLFKKNLVKNIRFAESLRIMEDKVFFLDCLLNSNSAIFLDEPLYNYYANPNSVLFNYNNDYGQNIIYVSDYIKNLVNSYPKCDSHWRSFCINNLWNIAQNEVLSNAPIKVSSTEISKYRNYLKNNFIKPTLIASLLLLKKNITWALLYFRLYRIFLYIWKKRILK